MTREELIAALEAATGPDRALDSWIGASVGFDGWTVAEWQETVDDPVFAHSSITDVPPYTASIDAALTLVPEGVLWAVGVDEDGSGCAELPRRRLLVHALTPAIALCIAALRARAVA